MSIDLDRLEALARAATPGPWEQGDVWLWAGVQPESFGEGCCALCERHGPPVWVGTRDINGEVRLAHKHRDPKPYDPFHDISAEDGLVAGNYGYEEGGIINPEDCAYIAAVSPDVVLELIKRLKGAESSWPYCGRCGEGEDAAKCDVCGEIGCEVCISRSGLCDLCREDGIT